ncbi:unnamed protein product [Rotaria sordida]|uniref:Uncharacterized protein n=1 Tax=Rotaria sordida TaxID=392033 RepID=A0A816BSD3_9BILA|nr:unnamed protein product [Rotaria sordida]CAF1612101.1 unnamed protein product [Rotaria sordida]
MFFSREDEIDEAPNSSQKNIVPQYSQKSENHFTSIPLKNNSKATCASSSSSLCIAVSKRYSSKFRKEWLSNPKYSSFLKEYKNYKTTALCFIYNIQFSIQNSETTDINNHMKTKEYQDCVKSAEPNKSKTINSLFDSSTSELNRLCTVEGALVFHGVKHSHSYLSQLYMINLTKKCSSGCSIAKKNITYSKTKTSEIACNVLAPAFTNAII